MKKQQANPSDEIIYVGMTGKFDVNGKLSQETSLKKRVYRTIPYNFTRNKTGLDYFQYGANASTDAEIRKLAPGKRYKNCVELSDLLIDCFIVDRNGLDAPAFLEAAILQAYLLNYSKLPAANNAF